jgi:hypothetical protein
LYRLHRASVRTDLRLSKVLEHLGIADVSEEEVDSALDEQQ